MILWKYNNYLKSENKVYDHCILALPFEVERVTVRSQPSALADESIKTQT